MIPLVVTAHLTTPVIGIDRDPMMLDAPLSWAYVMRRLGRGVRVPTLTPTFAADFPLPLAQWELGGVWGWKTSAGAFTPAAWVGVQVRRKPATEAMARYTTATKHHPGLGPAKARDASLAAALTRTVTWRIIGDRQELADLLALVTNLGARHRNDFGHVSHWTVEPDDDDTAWADRPLPAADGQPRGIRAPYWHPTRRHPCSWTPRG